MRKNFKKIAALIEKIVKNNTLFTFSLSLNIIFILCSLFLVNKIGFTKISNRIFGLVSTEIRTVYNAIKPDTTTASTRGVIMDMQGESLVLASTIPGKLCFDSIVPGSVIVRSTYLRYNSECKVYI